MNVIFAHLSFVILVFGCECADMLRARSRRRTRGTLDPAPVKPLLYYPLTAPSQPFFNRVRDFRLL